MLADATIWFHSVIPGCCLYADPIRHSRFGSTTKTVGLNSIPLPPVGIHRLLTLSMMRLWSLVGLLKRQRDQRSKGRRVAFHCYQLIYTFF